MPPFSCGLDDIAEFFNEIVANFPENQLTHAQVQNKLWFNISMRLGNEELDFNNFDEMKSFKFLNKGLKEFTVSIIGKDDYTFHLFYKKYSPTTVIATSNSHAWCAGTVELCRIFCESHKKWVGYIRGLGAQIIGNMMLYLGWTLLVRYNYASYLKQNTVMSAAYAIFFIVCYFPIIPRNTINDASHQSWIKKNDAEIKIVLALLGLLATIVKLFF